MKDAAPDAYGPGPRTARIMAVAGLGVAIFSFMTGGVAAPLLWDDNFTQ